MQKPLSQLTPKEKAALVARLKLDAAAEEHFTGVLGNRNSFFIARPARRRKPALRKNAKATA
jgi:hypothetical protein